MKRKCKDIDITDTKFIEECIVKCLNKKDKNRKDIHELFDTYGNVSNLASIISYEITTQNLILKPIWYKEKYDNSCKKLRVIGIQDIKQQIYDYIAVNALQPVLTRIGVHQYASIKGRGPIKGVKRIKKWLRNDNIKYACKLDIKKCYESINRTKLMMFLKRIVKNDLLLWLIETLINTFEKGLAIGSYLSQYLCNLYLSELYHNIYENMFRYRKKKTGKRKRINLVNKCLFYMDDILLLGTNAKDLNKAVEYIKEDANEMGLTIKPSWRTFKINTFIDIMGYRIYKNRITIRRRVFIRIKRTAIRFRKHKTIKMARRLLSYNGQLKNSNSYIFRKRNKWNDLFNKARRMVSNESSIRLCTT